jgi:hypothetical protein
MGGVRLSHWETNLDPMINIQSHGTQRANELFRCRFLSAMNITRINRMHIRRAILGGMRIYLGILKMNQIRQFIVKNHL